MKSHYLNLFEYDYWANQLVRQSISEKPLQNPKIENLFSHLLSAQKIWLNRCTQVKEPVQLWDTKTDLEIFMNNNYQNWLSFLENLKDDDLEIILDYKTIAGIAFQTKIKDILTHLINHGTYHRGQIVQLLKAEREEVPSTDFILWAR